MKRDYFYSTERIGFSHWSEDDLPLAVLLWGDPLVSRYICASGVFTKDEVISRLNTQLADMPLGYWPIFSLESGEFIGCCGLRKYPSDPSALELGFHLRPAFWGQGFASEAAGAAIDMAFSRFGASWIFAGHNPKNTASRAVLDKLGFKYIRDEFYPPTGLMHPSYQLKP